MRTIRFLWLMTAMLAVVLWIGACSDDDPVDPGGGGDTTAPQVVGVDPSDGQAAVNVDETITILFSEAMDPATSNGEITLSASVITSTDWVDDRTLIVDHGDWDEGAQITVTVGTGLTDVAGNALAAAYSFSFWTVAPGQLLLLDTTPADGALDVNRDTVVRLQFSDSVDVGTVSDNVTITDNPPAKANYNFTAEQIEDGLVLLTPNGTLPENTELTVIVGADVSTWGGTTLGTEHTFIFTTGVDVDVTPPTVVSTDPANGNMSVAVDQGFIRMTFSEPVNRDTVYPDRQNLAFYYMMMKSQNEPTWSEGGTVMTIALPSPLPAGLPVEVQFDDIEDLAGNVLDEPYIWDVKVAGTTEYVPVVDGARFRIQEEWAEGNVGNPIPQDTGSWGYLQQMEVQPDDSFRMVDYQETLFETPLDWEAYDKTASALQWLGFYEVPDVPVPTKEMFDTPLNILPLPIAVGTWTDNTTVTVDFGEGPTPLRATLHGLVLGKYDHPVYWSEGRLFIKDAWTVVRELEVEINNGEEWVTMFTQRDSVWYGPYQGDVRTMISEVNEMDNRWIETELWRHPWSQDMYKSQLPTSIEELLPQH